MKNILLLLLLVFFVNEAICQHINADTASAPFYTIQSVSITGNKHTKEYIIRRELHLNEGDTIIKSKLAQVLEDAKNQVHNLNLFSEEKVDARFVDSNTVNIYLEVKEKWFIYPTPQFQLADRNYNVWIKEHNASLKRVVYGAKFLHYNFSGRRDELKVYLLTGYSRNFSFYYESPYSNSALSEGFSVGAGYTQNREINYRTSSNNKLLQFNNGEFVRNVFSVGLGYQMRRGLFIRHFFSAGYNHQKVVDSLLLPKYNPYYFNKAVTSIGMVDFGYSYAYSKTDNVNFPLSGKTYSASIFKRGLEWSGNINTLTLSASFRRYFPHGRHWYSAVEWWGLLRLPFKQAYINQRALGFGDYYLRGLEYYVIDGVASTVARYTLKKKLFSFDIPVPLKIKAVPKIPFAFYAKTYGDVGYSYNRKPYDYLLNNKLLRTTGVGIDILTLYDMTLKLEFSFNQLGEKGLFLRSKGGF